MSTIEERTAYLNNPFLLKFIKGDYSPFYVTIGICTFVGVSIIILNVICACCSKHRGYWQDRHTGNRWLVSLWTTTPHKQPPLDLTELKSAEELKLVIHTAEEFHPSSAPPQVHRPLRPHQSRALLQQARAQREEYVELQKRESDI